jgi:preflagellin peptidase FlaK
MIVPLVIGSLAIILTLVYASWRDVLERRVAVRTWYPMLAVAVPMGAAFYLWTGGDARTTLAYCGLAAILLYDTLWLNRVSTKDHRSLTSVFLIAVLALVGISWLWARPPSLLLLFGILAVLLVYATWLDIRERANLARTWYLVPVLWAFALGEYSIYTGVNGSPLGFYLVWTAIFCFFVQLFLNMHLMGGADGYALIFIGLAVPAFPLVPLAGIPATAYFPLSVLVNALLLNIVTPLGIFLGNVVRRNRAPFPYLFLGFPVRGDRIGDAFGFLMEEIALEEGKIVRTFIPVGRLIGLMFAGKRTLSTQKMKMHPDQYAQELALCKKAGKVWIQYGIPFIIPIAAGFVTALIFGDILYTILAVAGGI